MYLFFVLYDTIQILKLFCMFGSSPILNNEHKIYILLEFFVFSKWPIFLLFLNISRKTELE